MKAEIPSLTGIRGLAALIVFFAHAKLLPFIPGGFGVTIFFFLSGYLITTLLRQEIEKSGEINFRQFYLRRALRIFPPMYLVLVLTIVLALLTSQDMTFAIVLAQAAHLSNYVSVLGNPDMMAPYTGPMWSLAIEEHFYLFFPLTLLFCVRRWRYQHVAQILAAACAAVLLWRVFLVASDVSSDYIYHATETRLDALLYGCIMGLWMNPKLDRPLSPLTGGALLIGSAAILLIAFTVPGQVFHDTLRYSLQSIGLFAVFYCAVRFPHWKLFSWLELPVMRYLGVISYMFYLSHMAFVRIGQDLWPDQPLMRTALAFLATLAFSAASYRWMEKPLGALRYKFPPKPVPAVAPA